MYQAAYCGRCGASLHPGGSYCAVCGEPVPSGDSTRYPVIDAGYHQQQASYVDAFGPGVRYAGFWLRLCAYLIDTVIIVVAFFVAAVVAAIVIGISSGGTFQSTDDQVLGSVVEILSFIGAWLYYTIMESSRHQATLGKMAVSLRVTDDHGARISFGRANGRYWGKILSGLILGIGYLMAAFTQKKQALHDMMAGCLVLTKR